MVRALVAALRTRADAFERAAARPAVTMQDLERDASITAAGEALDRALGRLRQAGFLPKEEPHDEERSAGDWSVGTTVPYQLLVRTRLLDLCLWPK